MFNVITVGEPINQEAWEWFYNVVGEGRCPLVDTWWQTGKNKSSRNVANAMCLFLVNSDLVWES